MIRKSETLHIITEHDRINLQEGLRKISEWSQRWEMPLNVNKSHILQVGTRNKKCEYEMNGTKLESVPIRQSHWR